MFDRKDIRAIKSHRGVGNKGVRMKVVVMSANTRMLRLGVEQKPPQHLTVCSRPYPLAQCDWRSFSNCSTVVRVGILS